MGYDAIIIGSGLGGCGAAAALTAAGNKVLILERLGTIGGRCSTAKDRDGFRMDVGCHHLFGCEHGAFEKAAKLVNTGGVLKYSHPKKLGMMVHDKRILLDGNVSISGGGSEEIVIETAEIFKAVPPRLLNIGLGAMHKLLPKLNAMLWPGIRKLDEVSIRSFMEKYIDWPLLADFVELGQFAAWGTPSVYTALSEGLRTFLGFMEYYEPGMSLADAMGYPIGGLGKIPETICEGVRQMGGEVRLNAGVKKIIVEGGRAVGVELEDGEVVKATVVISNAGVKETVADLVGEEHFTREYAKTIRELIVGITCFCVRAALDTRVTDLEGLFVVPQHDLKTFYDKLWNEKTIPPGLPSMMWSVPSNYDPTAAPEGKQLIFFVGPLMWGCEEPWNKCEQDALDAMELMIPGFKKHLMWHEYMTPDTYAALGEVGSPAIGIAQCIGQVGDKRTSVISPIKGLFYVGAEVGRNMSGVGTDMATRIGLACGDYIVKNTDPSPGRKLIAAAGGFAGRVPLVRHARIGAGTP